ncbi:MAG: TRAP transporter large permease, partial [Comamonas sp.]
RIHPHRLSVNFTSPFSLAVVAIVALSVLGVPIGQSMIAGSILYLYLKGMDMGSAAEQLLNSTYSSYLLLAIPLFILAASFMSSGSVLDRLLRWCNAMVGRFPGGLAQVNVLQSLVFASMSGSALADAAGSGKLMQALMTRDGRYTPAFAAALTAVTAVIGPILPPSIPLVLYALVSGTSIGYLFLAGILPGLLLTAVQMALVYYQAKRYNFPVEEPVPLRKLPGMTWEALPALMMPLLLLGCLYSGITTPTEAAGLAAAYALVIAAFYYRSLSVRDVYQSLQQSARTSISIGILIAGATVFNYVITSENIPASLQTMLSGFDLTPLTFLLLTNLLLLLLGAFLEGSTIILVILPVLLPTAVALGVDPVHFGVVAVLNIMIGLITPPYGLLLFMMTKIANVTLWELVRATMPFLGVMLVALGITTLWADFVLFLPRMAGYTG